MRALIFHNITTDANGRPLGMLDGYEHGHALVPVAIFDVDGDYPLEQIYHLLNVGDDPQMMGGCPDERAVIYRQNRNRSLSVGDVVALKDGDEITWSMCASIGWTTITPPRWLAAHASQHGTTAMDLPASWPLG